MTTLPRLPPLLEMSGIEKSFGGVQALAGAHLEAARGEIHALCGENGAGKSTLLRVLSGVYPHGSYRGSVRVDGKELHLRGTPDARRAGIAIVHQELMLVPELSVAANLFLGREPMRLGMLDDLALEARALALLARFGVEDLDPRAPIGRLGIGMQQMVEIVRALDADARILVLDEPTASLTVEECARLMDWLRGLRARGTTSIYVSHRMDEVFDLCDRVTVLRDGRTTRTVRVAESSAAEVVRLMVGRELAASVPFVAMAAGGGQAALELRGFTVSLPGAVVEETAAGARVLRSRAVEGVSMRVLPGEIVAVCGAMGAGRTALLSSLFGCARDAVSGIVLVAGAEVLVRSPAQAIAAGIALVPEDRRGLGLVPEMTVAENLALPELASPGLMGWRASVGLVDAIAETQLADRRIRELRIRGVATTAVSTLSGGNQQKVVLGKWLERPPRVLLLDEPTRGVDVGAREEIYEILRALAARGVAILLASSDLPEVLRLASRVFVLRHGRIVGELGAAVATQAAIVDLATGSVAPHAAPARRVPSLLGAPSCPP